MEALDLRDRGFHRREIGDVRDNRKCSPAVLANFISRRRQARRIAGQQRHVPAARGKFPRRRAADPGAGTRDGDDHGSPPSLPNR